MLEIIFKKVIFVGLTMLLLSMDVFGQKPDNYDQELKGMYNNTVPLITPAELKQQIENNANIVVLDTREKNEYEVSHIKGALYVGYSDFSIKSVMNIPKDSTIVVYCSLGVRSEKIGEFLLDAGYNNVSNLYGGIFEWVHSGNEVIDTNEAITLKIHAYDENWSKWLLKGEKVY